MLRLYLRVAVKYCTPTLTISATGATFVFTKTSHPTCGCRQLHDHGTQVFSLNQLHKIQSL